MNYILNGYIQLKHAIPNNWKTSIKLSSVIVSDLLVQDHDLIILNLMQVTFTFYHIKQLSTHIYALSNIKFSMPSCF